MIQYPKNEHITLPSVESWGTNMNILRDPPKSIHTRYIPKVGSTSKITEQIDGAGDRICEMIKPYARGVNPMVSVSYSNYGTNGGQVRYRGGAIGTDQAPITSGQSYLPYRIAREGAFRPPVIPPQELLPLSRLPRVTTKQFTNAGSCLTAFAERMNCKADLKEIRKKLLQVCAAPNAIFNIERPHSKPYNIKNYIQEDCRATNVIANKGRVIGVATRNREPERGINKNQVYSIVPSNISKNIQVKGLDSQCGNQPLPVKQSILNPSCGTNVVSQGGYTYIHDDIELKRNRPIASCSASKVDRNVDLNGNIGSRDYKNLPKRTSRGGFINTGFKPSSNRPEVPVERFEMSTMQKAARDMMSRY